MRVIKKYGLLYFAFLIYSFVSVFAKIASGQDSLLYALLFIGVEIIFLGLYALIWQQVLKEFPLVVAMSNKGIVVILGLIWAVLFFDEQITISNIVGALMIILGIWMVSSDD